MSAIDWVRGDSKVSAGLVAALAIMIGLAAIFGIPPLLLAWLGNLDPVMQSVMVTIGLFGVMAIVAFGWSLVARQSITVPGPDIAHTAGMGVAMGAGGVVVCVVYAAMAGGLTRQPGTPDIGLLLIMTPLILFQCVIEEIYFRGWIQPVLTRAFGPLIGVGVTAMAFAALHIPGIAQSLLSVVNITLAGLLFGLLAWRTGGLMAPMAAHFAWNWTESLGLGLFPNPGVDPTAIVDLDLTGPALWGGSPEGLNASLAATFVLLALCVPLLLWRRDGLKPATV